MTERDECPAPGGASPPAAPPRSSIASTLCTRILQRIHERPGVTLEDLLQEFPLSRKMGHNHVRNLVEEGVVQPVGAGTTRRLYPRKDHGPRSFLLEGAPFRRVASAIASRPGITLAQLRREVAGTRTVRYHVRKLQEEGFVRPDTFEGLLYPTGALLEELGRMRGWMDAAQRLRRPALEPLRLPAPDAAKGSCRAQDAAPAILRHLEAAFAQSPRRVELRLKAMEAVEEPPRCHAAAAGADAWRVPLVRAFMDLDLTAAERETLLGLLEVLLPPHELGWTTGFRRAFPREENGAATDDARELFARSRLALLGAPPDAAGVHPWRLHRDRAGLLVGGLDWGAPDAPRQLGGALPPPVLDTMSVERLAYGALLVEATLTLAAWGRRREAESLLPPASERAWLSWRCMTLATLRAFACENPLPELRPLLNVAPGTQRRIPAPAMRELVSWWPREWVPLLAECVRREELFDPAAASVVHVEAARALADAGSVPKAREWLDRIDLDDVRRHDPAQERMVQVFRQGVLTAGEAG